MTMKRVRWAAGLLCAALLLLGASPAARAVTVDYGRKGSIQVQLHLDISPTPDLSGAVFSLYRIGDIDNTGGGILYRLGGQFSGALLASPLEYTTSEEVRSAAEYLAGFVKARNLSPLVTAQTSQGGAATFSSLEVGVYFARATGGPDGLTVSPFIVSVPRFTRNHGLETLTYGVSVEPKAEFVPTPTPTFTPTATPCPTCPTAKPPGPPPKLPQTGFIQWPIIALAMGGGLLMMLGAWALLTVRKKKRSEP